MGDKIVFLDIDGTLLDHNKNIPASAKQAINKLKANGVTVAISTGRAPFMFQEILDELDIHSYVSINGQYVVHENKVIYANPIEMDQLERLTAFSTDKQHPVIYQSASDMKSNVADHPHIKTGMNSLKREFPLQESNYYKHLPIYQVLLFNEQEEQTIYEKEFPSLRFVRWHQFSCDVMPVNGSKANGIEQFIKNSDFELEDTYAFGDGLNDLEMLQKVQVGVAMGNSVPEVKEIADYVTEDVAEDGLAKGLEKIGLI
ncbi:hypothetical protein GGQ92_000071 [Gracilibacillus halotolerans]|uniref:Cof-type HAD-IIB family hydrolase n=1 Tax=Gracilibacillus halotolerans TaxID=74386 RepID=A0A841RK08_9BACI|nr:Cof-type HAD-IIB family hydrolase [Gracilibacillus halotolerans]MBB6511304.1 hypothetical protein [Gracilibacillus halotolerans]